MPKENNQQTVMVFGTFDLLHPGHENFFQQAKALLPKARLIVSIARDVNVERIKGFLPNFTERKRLNQVKKLPIVDLAILGSLKNYLEPIIKIKPDVIALGYDQTAYTENLQATLKAVGLNTKVVRLKAFKPKLYKSSILKKQI